MKKEELEKIHNVNFEIWKLSVTLDKRQETEGTQIDKIIVNLLKNITYLLDEVENLEKCKPF